MIPFFVKPVTKEIDGLKFTCRNPDTEAFLKFIELEESSEKGSTANSIKTLDAKVDYIVQKVERDGESHESGEVAKHLRAGVKFDLIAWYHKQMNGTIEVDEAKK